MPSERRPRGEPAWDTWKNGLTCSELPPTIHLHSSSYMRLHARDAMLPLLACAALLSCRDLLPRDHTPQPAAQARVLGDLTCSVTAADRTIVCVPTSASSTAARHRDIVGNAQIKMASTNVSLDTVAHVFQATVTVQNLLSYPLGTPDGTAVSGVKVFYFAGPTVTAYVNPGDTGTVTVRNADSTGNFTAAHQPYYFYNQILQPGAVSAPKLWQWNWPATVKSFSFQVKVSAATPGQAEIPLPIPSSWGQPRRYFREPDQMDCGKIGIPRCVYDVVDIEFHPTATLEERQAAIDAVGGRLESGSRMTARYYVQIPADTTLVTLQAAVATLRGLPQVKWAFPHDMTPLSLLYLRPDDGANWQRQNWRLSDSLASGRTWELDAISAPWAWGCENGSAKPDVAIVDHNFRTIQDLASTYAVTSSSGIDEYNQPQDTLYHGTEIASIIGASGNNGQDMTGVLWGASVHVYEASPDTAPSAPFRNAQGSAVLDTDTAVARIAKAAEAGYPVVNVSLGIDWNAVGASNHWVSAGSTYRPDHESNLHRDSINKELVHNFYIRFRQVLDTLNAHGKHPLIVLAAGNNELDAKWNGFAVAADSTSSVLVVGAVKNSGQGRFAPMSLNVGGLHFGSNYGPLVRIAAPGQGVWSWTPHGAAQVDGTSFAAPYVTGVAALLVAFDPRLRGHPDSLISLLVEGARRGRKVANLSAPQTDSIPVLNAYQTLRLAAQRTGAPLCGNRVWTQGGQLFVQRDTAAGSQPEVIRASGVLGSVTALHGGKQVAYYGEDDSPHMIAWSPTGWRDTTVQNFSDVAGPATVSYQGFSHDRDSAASAVAAMTGTQLYVRERVAPFASATGSPVYNWLETQGPLIRTPTNTSSLMWQGTVRMVTESSEINTVVVLDSTRAGTTYTATQPRLAYYPDGNRVLVAANASVQTTSVSAWSRCPGWETDQITYGVKPKDPGVIVDQSNYDSTTVRFEVRTHAECRDIHTSVAAQPATIYTVPLDGGAPSVLYHAVGGVDQLSVADGGAGEFYVRTYEQVTTQDQSWAAGASVAPSRFGPDYAAWKIHPVTTRSTPTSGCANQYRSLAQPEAIRFQVQGTAYDACGVVPFSFAPDRTAGGGTLFPSLAPVPPVLAARSTLLPSRAPSRSGSGRRSFFH